MTQNSLPFSYPNQLACLVTANIQERTMVETEPDDGDNPAIIIFDDPSLHPRIPLILLFPSFISFFSLMKRRLIIFAPSFNGNSFTTCKP